MEKIAYVTGNPTKFETAKNLMAEFDISLVQAKLSVQEIQSYSIEEVAIDKARQAFEILKKPLFVNDAGWLITALNGFPGPYMKFINKWFTAKDFIKLMSEHENREVILREYIVYTDGGTTKVFSQDVKGTVLNEIKGEAKHPSESVISLSSDGLSIAEEIEPDNGKNFLESEKKMWEEFASWLKERNS